MNIDIVHVDFQRPRQEVVENLGIENQECPVLVLGRDVDPPENAKESFVVLMGRVKIYESNGHITGVGSVAVVCPGNPNPLDQFFGQLLVAAKAFDSFRTFQLPDGPINGDIIQTLIFIDLLDGRFEMIV